MTPELLQRITVGILLIAVAVLELWLGGSALWVLATVAGLIMVGEWAGLTRGQDQRKLVQYAMCIPLALMSPLAAGPGVVALAATAGALLFVLILTRNAWLAAGIAYVGLPIMALLWIREQDHGILLAFWGLSLVWATDIGAFFAGRSFGGPKVAPAISPNKTWSGVIGGMVAAALLGSALASYADLPLRLALSSPALALLAQVGDFFESWMKRRAGVKDSGTILPGHGGVLDRLDGVVTSLPLAALLIWHMA
ncbi:phosphatidate cytidylyltransferase [Chakrabartia godavariana]|nr:phosphatidate cytidylyltransferase [Chakrabartia godavariana]